MCLQREGRNKSPQERRGKKEFEEWVIQLAFMYRN
jgi:hypothetical protein